MAQQVSVETQRAGLARRLRPLYADLRDDEFQRMVARIAEIELYPPAGRPAELGARGTKRAQRPKRSTLITAGLNGVGARVARHG